MAVRFGQISPRFLKRYAVAVAAMFVVSLTCYYLNAFIGLSTPLMLFIFASTFSAWYGGFGPGLLTTLTGAIVTSLYFRPLTLLLTPPAIVEDSKVLMSMLLGVMISWSFASLRRMKSVAEKSQREAVAREQHYRSILDSLSSYVGVLSPDRKIVYANTPSVVTVGESQQSVIGMEVPFTPWFKGLPEDQERMLNALKRASQGEHVRLDLHHRTADGMITDVDMSITPMRNAKGEITYLIPSSIDITERKRREAELSRAELAADVANKAKTLFLANMSHEIRTPLGVMLGFAELLREPEAVPQDQGYYIDSIVRNGLQLTRIIDEILDVSKIEADRMELDHVDFSLRDFAAEIQSFAEIQCNEKGLKFEFSLKAPQTLTMLTSDPARLRQIILNLTSNAVKFSDKGTVTVRLNAELDPGSARRAVLKVDVVDAGTGVADDQIEKLFLPFSQADNSMTRKFGGTGLGLYVSRKLARALEGEVVLQPRKLGVAGAHFTFTAPLRISAVNAAALATHASDTPDSQMLRGLRVLVVEDSPDNQHLISRFLTRAGATVECVNNGLDGCSRALKETFDVTLMDLQMPIMDGYEAIQKLREVGYAKPVIALTAHAFPAERQRCFELGFDEHLVKPIDRKILIETLRTYSAPELSSRCQVTF